MSLTKYLGLLLLSTALLAQNSVLIKSVDPDYGADASKPGLKEPVRVDVIVTPDGVPFALDSEVGLPDAVVKALQQYRFQRRPEGYGVTLTLTIPRPFEDYTLHFPAVGDQRKSTEAAKKLDGPKAKRLEDKLKPGSASYEERATLIAYGTLNDDPIAQQIRARQLAWLVLEQPDGEYLRRPNAFINVTDGPRADPQGYATVRQAWMDVLKRSSIDRKAMDNATRFLLLTDPLNVEGILTPQLPFLNLAATRLGELYALAALGVTGLSPETGDAIAAAGELPKTEFAVHAKTMLLQNAQARIVLAGADKLQAAGRSLLAAGQLPEGFQALCDAVHERARQLFPGRTGACDQLSARGGPIVIERSQIKKQTQPRYPDAAKGRRIQGHTEFVGTIGVDGKLHKLEFLNGPLVFYEASRNAILTWEYSPTRLNGQVVPVTTELEVNYTLH